MHTVYSNLHEAKVIGPGLDWTHIGVHLKLPAAQGTRGYPVFVSFSAPNVYVRAKTSVVPSVAFQIARKQGRGGGETVLFRGLSYGGASGEGYRIPLALSGTFLQDDPESVEIYAELATFTQADVLVDLPDPKDDSIPSACLTAMYQVDP